MSSPLSSGAARREEEDETENERRVREALMRSMTGDVDNNNASAQRRDEILAASVGRWRQDPSCLQTWSNERITRDLRYLRMARPFNNHELMSFLSALQFEEMRRCEIEAARMNRMGRLPGEDVPPVPRQLDHMSNEELVAEGERMQRLLNRTPTGTNANLAERDRYAAQLRSIAAEVERRTGVTITPTGMTVPASSPLVPPARPTRTMRDMVLDRANDIRAQRRRAEEARRQRVLASWNEFYKTYDRVRAHLTSLVGMRVKMTDRPEGALRLEYDSRIQVEEPMTTDNCDCDMRLVCQPDGLRLVDGVTLLSVRIQWYSGNPPEAYKSDGKVWKFNNEPTAIEAVLVDRVVAFVAEILVDGPHGDPPEPDDPSATRKGIDL